MRKVFALFSAALLTLAITAPVAANGNGATVINEDSGCRIIPPDWGGPMTLYGSVHRAVNNAGNAKLTCKFEIPEACVPDKAEKYKEFRCGIAGVGLTRDSWSVVSPGGNITLQCMVKAND